MTAAAGDNTIYHKMPRKIRYLYISAYNNTQARGIVSVTIDFQNTNFILGAKLPAMTKDPLIVEVPGELPVNEATLQIIYEDCVAADVLQAYMSYEYEV